MACRQTGGAAGTPVCSDENKTNTLVTDLGLVSIRKLKLPTCFKALRDEKLYISYIIQNSSSVFIVHKITMCLYSISFD